MTVSIGVLAGMGPRSTAPFIDMLVTDCHVGYGAKYDMDSLKCISSRCQRLSGRARKLMMMR